MGTMADSKEYLFVVLCDSNGSKYYKQNNLLADESFASDIFNQMVLRGEVLW